MRSCNCCPSTIGFSAPRVFNTDTFLLSFTEGLENREREREKETCTHTHTHCENDMDIGTKRKTGEMSGGQRNNKTVITCRTVKDAEK